MVKRIGVNKDAGVKVRDYYHFTECILVSDQQFAEDLNISPSFTDEDCTCWDDSPDWTLS
jgi:hypothetical protein